MQSSKESVVHLVRLVVADRKRLSNISLRKPNEIPESLKPSARSPLEGVPGGSVNSSGSPGEWWIRLYQGVGILSGCSNHSLNARGTLSYNLSIYQKYK